MPMVVKLSPLPPPPPTPLALLLMNGGDGSTVFADEASGGNWTNSTTAPTISTAQSKFGGASGYFGGSSYLYRNEASFAVGAGDFTIQGWVRASSVTGDKCIYSLGPNAYYGVYISGGTLCLYDTDYRAQTGAVISVDIWYHFAVCRSAGVVQCYVDGIGSASPYNSAINYSATFNYIASNSIGGERFTGYLDAIEYFDVALYDGDFTPPTVEPSMP